MSLKHRIARLEAKVNSKYVGFPCVVFGESGRANTEVTGASSNGNVINRQDGETVEVLITRSGRELRNKILFLIYADGRSGETCVVYPKVLATEDGQAQPLSVVHSVS